MLDEPIQLSPSDESWPRLGAEECSRLAGAMMLSPERIEHIGSTAVPGLLSKPIIDIQVGLLPFPPSTCALLPLAQLGYMAHGEAGVHGRLYFTSRGVVQFNVHVVQFGGEHWSNNLLLRQYLCESAVARERYAAAKLAATGAGSTTLLAYSAAKAALVGQLLAEAQAVRSAG